MRRTYEAIYEHGLVTWIGEPPDIRDGDRVVVIADRAGWRPRSVAGAG